MKVRIKKLSSNAVMPSKAHPTDAGFDLVATSEHEVDDDGNLVYHTGLAFEIPEGYVGFLFPRGSNAKKDLILSNSVGVIDSCFRGEVTMKFKPRLKMVKGEAEVIDECREPYGVVSYSTYSFEDRDFNTVYTSGDRIGQLIIMPIPEIEFEEADELTETDRGEGGYGSSGR